MQTELYAKAAAILAITGSYDTRVRPVSRRNQMFAVHFPEPLLGGLITGLIATAPILKPSGKVQTIELTSIPIF